MIFDLLLGLILFSCFIFVYGILPLWVGKTLITFYCTCEGNTHPRLVTHVTKILQIFTKTDQIRNTQIDRFIYALAVTLFVLDIFAWKLVWDEALLICVNNKCTGVHISAVANFLTLCLAPVVVSIYARHLEKLARTGQISARNATNLARIKNPETLTWRNIKKEMLEGF